MIVPEKTKLLEVIVTSMEDALEAEAGGADRLEVVRALELGGLTPDLEMVTRIAARVRIPLRVMIRDNPSMRVGTTSELAELCDQAACMQNLGVSGLVAGFLSASEAESEIDLAAMLAIANAAPGLKITFHRAFDELQRHEQAIDVFKRHLPQVDRVLTVGGAGSWMERHARLQHWRRRAAPQIEILAGAGLDTCVLQALAADPFLQEVHVGRAARVPQETYGRVNRRAVARLKGMLA